VLKIFKSLREISDKINDVVKYLGFVLMAVMTVVIVLQVFYRYVLDSSLSWSEELARYLFIWIVMLGASVGVKEKFHVAVTLIRNRVPKVLQQILDVVFDILLGVVALAMISYGYDLAKSVAIQLSPATRISMYWVYLSVPVSGVLIIIHLLSRVGSNMNVSRKELG